ncbi:hypothetical protein B5X24_HaOG203938 [Helicoverpa armigera]|uniref:FLYWCH-type domain-containing protein n=1 Tax=Helicoverpa armigera TaxID=29058 RepID=A0A2W1BUW6_HELAM|nr:hypothetical protein B5X24_HaOG203938 [Helicoverpa armigera]
MGQYRYYQRYAKDVVFSISRFGKPVLLYQDYRYNWYIPYRSRNVDPATSSDINTEKLIADTSKKTKMISAVFSTSRFGRPVILIGKYRFNRNTRSRGHVGWWCCSRARSSGCKATISTYDNVIIKIKNTHNHGPEHARI